MRQGACYGGPVEMAFLVLRQFVPTCPRQWCGTSRLLPIARVVTKVWRPNLFQPPCYVDPEFSPTLGSDLPSGLHRSAAICLLQKGHQSSQHLPGQHQTLQAQQARRQSFRSATSSYKALHRNEQNLPCFSRCQLRHMECVSVMWMVRKDSGWKARRQEPARLTALAQHPLAWKEGFPHQRCGARTMRVMLGLARCFFWNGPANYLGPRNCHGECTFLISLSFCLYGPVRLLPQARAGAALRQPVGCMPSSRCPRQSLH